MKQLTALLVAGTLGLVVASCGDDDGETVRDCPADSASGEASGSGSGAGSASGECPSGSASGSGSATAVCDPFGNAADADTTVTLTLAEFSITPDQDTAPAGKIHFAIENAGAEVHEVVVVRAGSIADLPLDGDGALDEAALEEGTLIGEVEGFPAGETCDGTFDLAAGAYVLLCNIVEEEDGTTEAHLAEGMAVPFTVT
jgi:hypothetical protein